MIGSLLLTFAFSAALVSLVSFGLTLAGRGLYLKVARAAFHATVVSYLLAAAFQMYLIFTHQTQYTYIWQHTSTNLSTPLLFASFYAGQEGSFMLWTLWVSLIGIFVLSYAQKVKYEKEVMTTYMFVLSCLLLILVVKSPFLTVFQSFPDQNIAANIVPVGKGLNPTLENLWITIHPPILFTGFAAMTVPFVFAMAGLMKKDYQRWISISLPWALFASMVLGFGIMLGGWWAYETLGWGGFWAWDPVENSSLIPWLACVALVHSMLVQKRTGSGPSQPIQKVGGLVKTNFVLATAAFGLILYSTFLTRSGILGDTSVHSFVDPGNFVYVVLLCILIAFMLIGGTLIAWRWKDLRMVAMNMKLMSRENALALGSATLLASAVVVLVGTSWPIFMPLFNKPKVAVPTDFYNNLHLPIALIIVLLNAISMVVKWKNTPPGEFQKKMLISLLFAMAGTGLLVVMGNTDPLFAVLGFGALLLIAVNVQVGWKVLRGNPKFAGAYVAHFGVGVLILGIIGATRYSETQHVQLLQGQSKEVFGYKLTYLGGTQIDQQRTDQERYQHQIQVENGSSKSVAKPIIFFSDFNQRESPFMEPSIIYTPTRDLYISPKALEQIGGNPTATLHKGDKIPVPFDSSMTVRFEKFDMSRAATDGFQGAVMEVTTKDSSYFLTSYVSLRDGQYLPVSIPKSDVSIGMARVIADKENLSNSQALLVFQSPSHPAAPAKDQITLDVSIKPFISLVWGGVIIMVIGFFLAILRRRREVNFFIPKEQDLGRSFLDEPAPFATNTLAENVVARSSNRGQNS